MHFLNVYRTYGAIQQILASSHLLCTLVPSSPPCRPWHRWGHSWSGQRSHCGPCRTCCRKVRSSLNHSGNEAGTPGWESARGDGTSATVHQGSTWRRGGLAQSTLLKEEGRRKYLLRFLRLSTLHKISISADTQSNQRCFQKGCLPHPHNNVSMAFCVFCMDAFQQFHRGQDLRKGAFSNLSVLWSMWVSFPTIFHTFFCTDFLTHIHQHQIQGANWKTVPVWILVETRADNRTRERGRGRERTPWTPERPAGQQPLLLTPGGDFPEALSSSTQL